MIIIVTLGSKISKQMKRTELFLFTYFDLCSQAANPDVTDIMEERQYFIYFFNHFFEVF